MIKTKKFVVLLDFLFKHHDEWLTANEIANGLYAIREALMPPSGNYEREPYEDWFNQSMALVQWGADLRERLHKLQAQGLMESMIKVLDIKTERICCPKARINFDSAEKEYYCSAGKHKVAWIVYTRKTKVTHWQITTKGMEEADNL